MPATDDTTPATKKDIRMIMEMIGVFMDETRGLIGESEHRTRIDIQASEERIKADFRRDIGIVREEVAGANADRLSQYHDRLDDHDRRIVVLEGAASVR